MTKLGRFTILLIIPLLFVSCLQLGSARSHTPAWLDRGYDATYNEETYLCAVGSGSTRERAVEAALSSLSQIFNSQVRSVTEVTSSSSSETDAQGNVTFAESSDLLEIGRVASQTDQIIGAEVVGTYTDATARIYVRVALHRRRTADLYQNRIAALSTSIAQARSKSMLEGDALRSYLQLLKGRDLAHEQQSLYDQLQVLLKKPQQQVLLGFERDLAALAQKIAMKVEVVTDEKSSATLQSAFERGLQNLGFQLSASDQAVVLLVQYRAEPLILSDSPYRYARYQLAVQLQKGSETYLSYEKSEREAALSESDAVAKALRSAAGGGVDEFFSLMLKTLGDET